ncbi:hypothetical protein Tco_1065529 [Tanacetum coccineum]
MGEGLANPTDPHHTPTIIKSSTQPQKTQKPRKPKRKDTQATPNEFTSLGTTSGGVPRCQETMGDTTARTRVLDLEKTKTTHQNEIDSLKRRVKKLEKKRSSRAYKLKRLYKVSLSTRVESSGDEESLGEDASKQGRRINSIDAEEDINSVNVQDDVDNEMFDVDALNGEEVFVPEQNENVVEEVVNVAQVKTAATTDKGKGIMIEEPVKPMKKKVQIMLDEEVASKLQAEFDEEERLAREKAKKEKEANIAMIETWDDIQNMEGYKLKDLKSKGFDSIHEMFDRAFKRVNTFEDFRTELVEGKEKRAGEELIQESSKKQKVDDNKETTELKQCMEVIPNEKEVTIDAIPLAVKSLRIVD